MHVAKQGSLASQPLFFFWGGGGGGEGEQWWRKQILIAQAEDAHLLSHTHFPRGKLAALTL